MTTARRRGASKLDPEPAPDAIRFAGELTIQTAAENRRVLVTALERNEPLELNLSQVTELDTAGLQVLLLARREAVQRGQRFSLTALPPAVLDVLHIVGLDGDLQPTGVHAVPVNPGQDDQ